MSIKLILPVLLSVFLLGACGRIPFLYRVDIQQGNVIDQSMVDKLKPGMDKNQVHFILGTPAVADTFHTNQWDYLFTSSESGDTREQRHLRIYFKEDKLAYIDGDVVTSNRIPDDTPRQSRTVEVPADYSNRGGFFGRLFSALPFVGDDRPAAPTPAPAETPAETP